MKKYKFSIPLPYSKEQIPSLVDINKEIEKSEITSLYFSLPHTCELYAGFEQPRNRWVHITDFQYWSDIMKSALDSGFECIYCLNSPRQLDIENPNFASKIKKL